MTDFAEVCIQAESSTFQANEIVKATYAKNCLITSMLGISYIKREPI